MTKKESTLYHFGAALNASAPSSEEFNRRMDEHCKGCSIAEYAKRNHRAAQACRRCREMKERLKAEYSKTRPTTAQDGQDAAAGISPTDAEKGQEEITA